MELELIDDAGRWTLTGPAGERWRIGSAGLRLTCPALTVAHGAGGRAEYYRHGWSSWAPARTGYPPDGSPPGRPVVDDGRQPCAHCSISSG